MRYVDNPPNPWLKTSVEWIGEPPEARLEVFEETATRTIITHNQSPDVGFEYSVNCYRGCTHACTYCFSRPTHEYLGFGAGTDFERKIVVKVNAAKLLRAEMLKPSWKGKELVFSFTSDPYLPLEAHYKLTRACLEVCLEFRNPVGIVTKSALVLRDLDLLTSMAKRGLVKVALSVTTLDRKLARAMEPRASTPDKRLETLERLVGAGVPASVMVAPVIPGLTDMEMERILERASSAGVTQAGYVLLRLPLEIGDLFTEWLMGNCPDRAKRVLSLMRSTRGGKLYDAKWGERMVGDGPYAWMIGRRFEVAAERLGLNKSSFELRTDLFTPPVLKGQQMRLF
jgi:DNA repair photolyase